MILSRSEGVRYIHLSYDCDTKHGCNGFHSDFCFYIKMTQKGSLSYFLKRRTTQGWSYLTDMTLIASTPSSFKFESDVHGQRLTIRFITTSRRIYIKWCSNSLIPTWYCVSPSDIANQMLH